MNKKGFTLLEILVASGIFALVMTLAVGTFGMGSNFSGKMKEQRKMSEGSRKLADMITADIRNANTPGDIHLFNGSSVTESSGSPYKYKNGIAMLYCNSKNRGTKVKMCSLINNTNPDNRNLIENDSPYNDSVANVLVIFNKNWTKVYYSERDMTYSGSTNETYRLYYKKYASTQQIDISSVNNVDSKNTFLNDLRNSTNEITNMVLGGEGESKIIFNGFTPDDTSTNHQQPYVNFLIRARSATSTKHYDDLSVYQKAQTFIQSTVAVRSYNQ